MTSHVSTLFGTVKLTSRTVDASIRVSAVISYLILDVVKIGISSVHTVSSLSTCSLRILHLELSCLICRKLKTKYLKRKLGSSPPASSSRWSLATPLWNDATSSPHIIELCRRVGDCFFVYLCSDKQRPRTCFLLEQRVISSRVTTLLRENRVIFLIPLKEHRKSTS